MGLIPSLRFVDVWGRSPRDLLNKPLKRSSELSLSLAQKPATLRSSTNNAIRRLVRFVALSSGATCIDMWRAATWSWPSYGGAQ